MMSRITDNLQHFLKVQSQLFEQARVQATKQADDLGIKQFEPRMDFIQQRMDELLGVYSRYYFKFEGDKHE
jgi:hypothetical protein